MIGTRDAPTRSGAPVRCILATVKNEGPFLLEWLAYHRLIGFDRFVVFSNDCTDGTHEMLQALDGAGLVHHFDNSELSPDLPADPQGRAYTRANAMPLVRESDWIMVIDGDEFLSVKVGDGTLDALLDAVPERTDAIGVQWRVFGSGGVIRLGPDLQIDSFRRAAPLDFAPSLNHLAIKTLFRPEPVQRFGIHRPVFKGTSGTSRNPVRFVNGSGEDITADFLRGRWRTTPQSAGYRLAQVNHYMIRAHEVFLMKKWRGTANSANADRINFDYFDRYNSNHDRDDGMARWIEPVRAEIAAIEAAVPGLSELAARAVAAHADRIAELKEELRAQSPEAFRRLFDPETVAAELSRQAAELAELRARHGDGVVRMFPRPAARAALPSRAAAPSPGSAPRVIRLRQTADDEALEEDASAPDRAAVSAAPGWLSDLRGSPFRRGFYQSFQDHAVHFVARSPERLVVSFDNLSSVRDDAVDRESWGYGFIRKNGWSHLGVMAFRPDWFRADDLIGYLKSLAGEGFFRGYPSVTLIGTSMGAYAASAFAPLAPGCGVVAFSPQSTLRPDLVPWEERFIAGRRADWSGEFADAAVESRAAERVWLLYDPRFAPDRMHAERYAGPNVTRLKARHAGHKTALFLRRAELLSTVVREAVAGTLDEAAFYAMYRRGRQLPWYLNAVADRVGASGDACRLRRVQAAIGRLGRPQVARMIHQRFPELATLS